jgi:hypothetical protein
MTQLYSVSFTTKTPVHKFDSKGNPVAIEQLNRPVTMHALPYSTAMSYSKCDDFVLSHYVPDQQRVSKGSGRDNSIGNGTKKMTHPRPAAGAAKVTTSSKLDHAARTGDMGAAINS